MLVQRQEDGGDVLTKNGMFATIGSGADRRISVGGRMGRSRLQAASVGAVGGSRLRSASVESDTGSRIKSASSAFTRGDQGELSKDENE